MQWTPGNRDNIEDRRGIGGTGIGGMHVGLGGLVVLMLLSWATGTNFLSLLGTGGGSDAGTSTSAPIQTSAAEERQADLVSAVARDVEQVWSQTLGGRYQRAKVVLFRDVTDTACGAGERASGPFYCPGDGAVYLDLDFFQELAKDLGAPGEFAQAYVIAHEYGHHVQDLLGIAARRGAVKSGPDSASVAIELQADCFAGVWGHAAAEQGRAARGQIELDPGDVEAGLRAAAAVGDDRLQKLETGRVQPERFTHGTSEQRVTWFRRGMETGDPKSCEGFRQLAQ